MADSDMSISDLKILGELDLEFDDLRDLTSRQQQIAREERASNKDKREKERIEELKLEIKKKRKLKLKEKLILQRFRMDCLFKKAISNDGHRTICKWKF